MQSIRKTLLIMVFLLSGIFTAHLLADNPLDAPPPPPGGGHGGGGNQSAPIDGGLSVLMALGAGYGSFKLYKKRKDEKKPGTTINR
ncbi:MAG: hypothetical protein WCK34_02435 [Bacteroidota bacterium]